MTILLGVGIGCIANALHLSGLNCLYLYIGTCLVYFSIKGAANEKSN